MKWSRLAAILKFTTDVNVFLLKKESRKPSEFPKKFSDFVESYFRKYCDNVRHFWRPWFAPETVPALCHRSNPSDPPWYHPLPKRLLKNAKKTTFPFPHHRRWTRNSSGCFSYLFLFLWFFFPSDFEWSLTIFRCACLHVFRVEKFHEAILQIENRSRGRFNKEVLFMITEFFFSCL